MNHTQELKEMIQSGKIDRRGIKDLMLSVGLEPLPRVANRSEVARCLKTRFSVLTDAVPELLLV